MKLNLTTLAVSLNVAGLLGALGIAAVCYAFVQTPMRNESAGLQRRQKILRNLQSSRLTIQKRVAELQERIQHRKPRLRDMAKRIPDTPREGELLKQLSHLAEHSGVQLQDFQPGGQAQFADLDSTVVNLRLRGDYHKLCQFVDGLESRQRLMRIADLQIRLADPRNLTLDVRIRLLAFYQPSRAKVSKAVAAR